MPTPVLIDTDMGIDDAVAIALAHAVTDIDLVGLVSVAGNVSLEQATQNIGRLLNGLKIKSRPAVGRGLSPEGRQPLDATHVFGVDGLGEIDLPVGCDFEPRGYLEVYEKCLETHADKLVIVAIGPLTNLAALHRDRSDLLRRAARIIIMGGAVWCPGNVTPFAEFNFYYDPSAAEVILTSGLPITVVPLDVTRQVGMDVSHMAHLSRSGTIIGELLGRMLRYPLEQSSSPERDHFLVHDALTIGILLWPELFMQTKMALQMVPQGEQAGRCRPAVVKDKHQQLGVVISVNATDFLENLLEQLCHEKFVV